MKPLSQRNQRRRRCDCSCDPLLAPSSPAPHGGYRSHINELSQQGRVGTPPTASTELVVANDNRIPAGALANGTLTIRLEARLGQWHPDGNSSPGVTVKAFSANGGPLHVPGPLIRVRQGTTVRASVRNVTSEPLAVHGLYSRPGSDSDVASPFVIAPGETREVTFLASTPGMYYYWGATDAATTLAQRLGRDTQLTGAFVVDAAGRLLRIASSCSARTPTTFWLALCRAERDRRRYPSAGISIRHERCVLAPYRAVDLQRGRHGAHAAGECGHRRPPDALARVLLQRGHAR